MRTQASVGLALACFIVASQAAFLVFPGPASQCPVAGNSPFPAVNHDANFLPNVFSTDTCMRFDPAFPNSVKFACQGDSLVATVYLDAACTMVDTGAGAPGTSTFTPELCSDLTAIMSTYFGAPNVAAHGYVSCAAPVQLPKIMNGAKGMLINPAGNCSQNVAYGDFPAAFIPAVDAAIGCPATLPAEPTEFISVVCNADHSSTLSFAVCQMGQTPKMSSLSLPAQPTCSNTNTNLNNFFGGQKFGFSTSC